MFDHYAATGESLKLRPRRTNDYDDAATGVMIMTAPTTRIYLRRSKPHAMFSFIRIGAGAAAGGFSVTM